MNIAHGKYEVVEVHLDDKLLKKLKKWANAWDMSLQDVILQILRKALA
jgi:hypothetical protein